MKAQGVQHKSQFEAAAAAVANRACDFRLATIGGAFISEEMQRRAVLENIIVCTLTNNNHLA